MGMPSPNKLFAGLARAAHVHYRYLRKETLRNGTMGTLHFEAWTDPDTRYQVVYDPIQAGGWCKHCAACAAHLVGKWLADVFGIIETFFEKEKTNAKSSKKGSGGGIRHNDNASNWGNTFNYGGWEWGESEPFPPDDDGTGAIGLPPI